MQRWIAIGVIALTATFAGRAVAEDAKQEVAPGLSVGDMLDQSNWQLAKDLLPPEILKHYEKGGYNNRIGAAPADFQHWDDSFEQATKENAKNLDVNDQGSIIDKQTGKMPPYLYGIPFPNIDPNDPGAGVKVVWNEFANYWNVGNGHYYTTIVMISPTAREREIVEDTSMIYYDDQAPKYRPAANPLNLSMQMLAAAVKPTDLNGTATLVWRFRDADKRDAVWAFVPALRRVRAVTPANRSDGFLGSDVSQDDGHFFDGKPEDFTWKLVGLREGLRFADPTTMNGYLPFGPPKEGGFSIVVEPELPALGFRVPGWKGLAWAPVDPILIKRKMWVVEGVPKDKYYLYGKLELWADNESWIGAWNRKYSWDGELLATYQISTTRNNPAGPPEAREWVWNGSLAYQCVESLKQNRVSCAGSGRPFPGAPMARRVPLNPQMFDSQALQRYGK
ncbi:MAG: outer membrane lipoprotein-sorting protein [Candidatus Binatia bacterium]